MNPLPNEILFLVKRLTIVRSDNSEVLVSYIGFYKVTTTPPFPLGLTLRIFNPVSLLMFVLYELDCLSYSALCSRLMHSINFLK